MSTKSYNRTIRALKLTFEALWVIMWPQFLGWAKDQGFDDADLQRLSKQLAHSLYDNGEDETPSEVMQQLEHAVQYVHLLQLLEQYETLHEHGYDTANVHTHITFRCLADA